MKSIYNLIFICLLVLGINGCVDDPVVDTTTQNTSAPEISDTEKLKITASTIELSAEILKENGAPVHECGFCWSKNTKTDPDINIKEKRFVVSKNVKGHNFTATIDNLEDNTKYYIYAYAINKSGITFSPKAGVYTTNLGVGEVYTCKIDSQLVKALSVTVRGKVKSRGEGIEKLGFYWSDQNTEPSEKDSVVYYNEENLNEVDSFTCTINGLKPETTYYVRAFAKNKFGEFSYSVESFKTKSGRAVVDHLKVDSVSFTFIDLSAMIADKGESDVTAYGFCWGTTDELSIEKNNTIPCHELNEANKFTTRIKDLKPNKRYTVCAYVTNKLGTSYTPVKALFTRSDALTISMLPINPDMIIKREALVVGKLVNKEHLQVDSVGFCWSDEIDNPTIELGDSCSVRFSAKDLNEVDKFMYTITNLLPGRTYHVNAFVKRHNGSYEYSSDTQQFSTPQVYQSIEIPDQLQGLTFSSSFSMDNAMYILGGDRGSSCSGDFYLYNPYQNHWNGLSPLITEAGHMTASVYNKQVYVVGGLTKQSLLSNMNEYDYYLNKWSKLKSMPEAAFDAHSFIYHDSLYVIGGELANSKISSKLYRYDINGQNWKLITDTFPANQKKGISFVLGDSVYVGLGEGSENRLWMSTNELVTWKEISGIPGELKQANSLVHYKYNGINSLFILDSKGHLWEADLNTRQWKKRTVVFPGEVLKNSSLILVRDNIYILGQKDNNTSYLKRYNIEWDSVCEIVK